MVDEARRAFAGCRWELPRLPAWAAKLLCLTLLSGCGDAGELADGGEQLGQVTQASTCSNPGNQIVNVSSYTGNQGLSKEWLETYHRAVGYNPRSGCSGVNIGRGLFLTAGTCGFDPNNLTNERIFIGGVSFDVSAVLAQSTDPSNNFALLLLGGSQDLDADFGLVRLGYRVPAANEKIGAIMANVNGTFFVGGTVSDNNVLINRFRHRLDTPTPYGRGAPIIDENGYLVGIHTDDTCTSSTTNNAAMMVQRIIDNSWDLTTHMWTSPCSGLTKASQWQQHSTNLIYTDISTAACGFPGETEYFSSLTSPNQTNIADTISATAVYLRTNTGFRAYVERPGLTAAQATSWNWRLNWQGFPSGYNDEVNLYRCTSTTRWDTNTWVANGANEILQDVVISPFCRTVSGSSTPRRVHVSLEGTNARQATGVNKTHINTNDGFRIYLQRAGGITPAQATSWNWHLNYEVSTSTGSGRVEAVGQTPVPKVAGDSQPGWKVWTGNGVYIDVPNPAGWQFTPKYFANLESLAQADQTWGSPPVPPQDAVKGPTSIYNPTKSGFRMYVKTSASVQQANSWWRVHWVAVP